MNESSCVPQTDSKDTELSYKAKAKEETFKQLKPKATVPRSQRQ